MLECLFPTLVDCFGSLSDTLLELFLLGFDFGVESGEYGKDLAGEGLGGLCVDVGDALGVCADVVEHFCYSTEVLGEVVAFFQGTFDSLKSRISAKVPVITLCSLSMTDLQHLFILFCMVMLHLLRGLDIVNEIVASAAVSCKTIAEQLGHL